VEPDRAQLDAVAVLPDAQLALGAGAHDEILAFRDLYPKAPIHLLIIPRRHIESIARLEPGDAAVVGRCLHVARLLGERTGYAERGYRVSCNTGPEGGQVVYHLHFHFTAGRR
jgi:histidine triad (HIT) family protein